MNLAASQNVLARRLTYLGVRHYFVTAARSAAQTTIATKRWKTNPENKPKAPWFAKSRTKPISTPTKPTTSSSPPTSPARKLTAAEAEWLQEDHVQDISPSTLVMPGLETEKLQRHDWRLRAPSRLPKPDNPSKQRKKILRRRAPPFKRVAEGEPFYEAIGAYEDRFLKLLKAEQSEDEQVLQERLSSWSLPKLQEEGYTLTGLSACWLQANQFGRPVASFTLGPGIALPENKFENGTQLLISRIDPLKEEPRRASVVSRNSSQIRVAFAEHFDDLEDGEWRVDLGLSNIVYERMRNAINAFHFDPQALENVPSDSGSQSILAGTHLRDVLLHTFDPAAPIHPHEPLQAPDEVAYPAQESLEHDVTMKMVDHPGAFKDDMRIQSWARRYMEVDPLVMEGDPVLPNMNVSQRRAMAMMVGQSISLVQGPPGTGKTKTIIETVKLLKAHFEVPHPLLVCTYTNVAVDNLVEGLAAAGVKPLRIAFGGHVRSSLVEHTLDHKLSLHPLQTTLQAVIKQEEALRHKIDELERKIKQERDKVTLGNKTAPKRLERMTTAMVAMAREHGVLKARKYGLQQTMLEDVIKEADVICTTCITSACMALNVTDFPVVFLDEASMSTEPASLIPLMKGSRHVALIGDHKQLPPVITSPEAQANGLGVSLFERLTEEGVVPSIMLDVQYRMHPAISHFPSAEFYNSTLTNGTVDAIGNVQPRLLPPTSKHLLQDEETGKRPSVIFLDHSGAESFKDRSRVNHHEAHIIASVVEDLLLTNPDLQGRDIGIIAPYVAQISLLTRVFNRDAKYRARFKEVLGDQRAMQLGNIEIKTVDGFEGREKEVIIFSTVRNNPGGYIGFLADRRRLNVGLTRAKRGLFVVGNIDTLKAGKMSRGPGESSVARVGKGAESWRRYVKYLMKEGLVLKLEGDVLGQTLYGHWNSAKALRAAPTAC